MTKKVQVVTSNFKEESILQESSCAFVTEKADQQAVDKLL